VKTKVGYWLLVVFLFGFVLLCPRPWLTEFHVWGRDIPLGFPVEAFSIQLWDKTQAEPGKLAVFPDVPGLILNLMIVFVVVFILRRRLWCHKINQINEQTGGNN
jgi:hypothetical protein